MDTYHPNHIFAEHYLLKARLISGPVSDVWQSEDWTAAGEIVALKLFTPNAIPDRYTLKLLCKELEVIAALEHPNLLRVEHFDTYEGVPYLIMPYLSQGTLRQRLHRQGPLQEQDIALILKQVSQALAYLHASTPAVLHQSLTPDNILISEDDDFVLTPPALSNQLQSALHQANGSQLSPATAYAAPELSTAHPMPHEASDIFALGVTLYELCTGALPWRGNGGLALINGADLPSLPENYSHILNSLISACLDPDWKKRPTARLLADEAGYFLENGNWKPYGSFGHVTAESIVYKKRGPFIPVLAGFLILLAALAASYYFYFDGGLSLKNGTITLTRKGKPQKPTGTRSIAGIQASQPPEVKTDSPIVSKALSGMASDAVAEQATSQAAARTNSHPVSTPQKRTYPRPKGLEDYLNAMLDEEIPLQVKDQWRTDIRKYFRPDAIVYAQMNGAPLGSFGVSEFMDILLSSESGTAIQVDTIIRDEEGVIEEIKISVFSA